MNTFTLDQINDYISSAEGQAKIGNLQTKMVRRVNPDLMPDMINDAYVSLAEKVIESGGSIETDKSISTFILSYFNVVMMRQNTLEYRHQNRQQTKVFDQEYNEESTETFFNDNLFADEDIEAEIDTKMRVEAMGKILDKQDYEILKELVYLGRSTNALASQYGVSPYMMAQRINEIYEKVENYLA